MLNEYERYQLQWMIDNGHSLDELMAELSLYQNELLLKADENLSVQEVFNEWVNDRGFGAKWVDYDHCLGGGELFASKQEWRESEGRAMMAHNDLSLTAALAHDNGAFYDPERGILIASYMTGYDDPTIEVYKTTTAALRKLTSELTELDIEYGLTTHEIAGNYCAHICSFRSIADLREAGYLDSKLVEVSDTRSLVDVVSRLTLEDGIEHIDVGHGEQGLDDLFAAKSDEADLVADGAEMNGDKAVEHDEIGNEK